MWPPPGRGTGVNMCPRGPGQPFIVDLEELFGITQWITHTRLLLRAAYTTGPQLNTQESRGRGGGLTQQLHGALGSCHTSPSLSWAVNPQVPSSPRGRVRFTTPVPV